jgi:hypothetical protein
MIKIIHNKKIGDDDVFFFNIVGISTIGLTNLVTHNIKYEGKNNKKNNYYFPTKIIRGQNLGQILYEINENTIFDQDRVIDEGLRQSVFHINEEFISNKDININDGKSLFELYRDSNFVNANDTKLTFVILFYKYPDFVSVPFNLCKIETLHSIFSNNFDTKKHKNVIIQTNDRNIPIKTQTLEARYIQCLFNGKNENLGNRDIVDLVYCENAIVKPFYKKIDWVRPTNKGGKMKYVSCKTRRHYHRRP